LRIQVAITESSEVDLFFSVQIWTGGSIYY